MSRLKVDLATEADWSFYDIPEAVEALECAAGWVAHKGELEYDDCLQDALLWASVRPGVIERHGLGETWDLLSHDCYSGLSRAKKTEAKRWMATESYEEQFGPEGGDEVQHGSDW